MTRNAFLVALLAGGVAWAQGGPPPGIHPGGRFGPGMDGAEFGIHSGKVVTGAAYSADVTNVHIQTLPDGNVLQTSTTGRVARDNDGRTYSQETFTGGMLGQNGPKTIVFIADPVAGFTYVLDPTTKKASRRALKSHEGRGPRPERPAADSLRPTAPDVTTADLGVQTINGVSAQGKSTTRTIAAGAIGNTLPIISTSETWYSPDLQIYVSSKRVDPRTGQVTHTLTNIQRTAPDAALFQIPAGYTVEDAPAMRGFGPQSRGQHGAQ